MIEVESFLGSVKTFLVNCCNKKSSSISAISWDDWQDNNGLELFSLTEKR